MVGDNLPKREANYAPLTPITFLQRTAAVFPDRHSVIYGARRFTWVQTLERCRRLASALQSLAISAGDTVAVVSPNVPAMYELSFGVPMAGAVLNTLNIRLDARTMAVMLGHSEAKVVFVDTEFLPVVQEALSIQSKNQPSVYKPLLVHIQDDEYERARGGATTAFTFGKLLEYEELLKGGNPNYSIHWPVDEWDAISINYTSGTTAHPKGAVYHHRGAYLNVLATSLAWQMQSNPVYLWSLPMFHCNGWCFPWIVAAQAGTNVCLRTVTSKGIYDAIGEHHVTHLCGAPAVLNIIYNSQEFHGKPVGHTVHIMTGAAPPPAAILAKLESLGFSLTHAYGLTETYGPAVSCVWKDEWNTLPLAERARWKARQGVGHLAITGVDVVHPETMNPVPRDGLTMGEVTIKGHTIMKGYLKDTQATEDAFKGGWFHTGDLGVMHPDGYIQLKDRSKDIIISGGENISSLEVESILYTHPQIVEAAVVARPDKHWGETPCAFVTLKDSTAVPKSHPDAAVSEQSIIAYCRANLPHYMVPRTVVFGSLPKTNTGKVQKNILRERASKLHLGPTPKASKL